MALESPPDARLSDDLPSPSCFGIAHEPLAELFTSSPGALRFPVNERTGRGSSLMEWRS